MNINMQEFLNKFNQEYEFLYNMHEKGMQVAGEDDALDAFDNDMQHEKFKNFVIEFVKYRNDYLTSDREIVAFEFACESFGLFNELLA